MNIEKGPTTAGKYLHTMPRISITIEVLNSRSRAISLPYCVYIYMVLLSIKILHLFSYCLRLKQLPWRENKRRGWSLNRLQEGGPNRVVKKRNAKSTNGSETNKDG